MKAVLFRGHEVEIIPESVELDVSWCLRGNETAVASEPEMLQFLSEQIDTYINPNLVDIGAGTGCVALLACVHPSVAIAAYEPHPGLFEVLRGNIALNEIRLTRVLATRVAVSRCRGSAVLTMPIDGPQSSRTTCAPTWPGSCRTIRVHTRLLDDLLHSTDTVDIMKVSAEGSELRVLKGAEAIIKRCKPSMLIDFDLAKYNSCRHSPRQVLDLIELWGAEVKMAEWGKLWVEWPEDR